MGNQPWPQFQNGIRERSIGLALVSLPTLKLFNAGLMASIDSLFFL